VKRFVNDFYIILKILTKRTAYRNFIFLTHFIKLGSIFSIAPESHGQFIDVSSNSHKGLRLWIHAAINNLGLS